MKRLSDSELEIMKVVWRLQPVPVNQLAVEINAAREQPVSRTTVLKQVQRMEAAGLLERDDQRPAGYKSMVAEGEVTRKMAGEFVEKLFGGSVAQLIRCLLGGRDNTLSEAEADELRALIDRMEGKRD